MTHKKKSGYPAYKPALVDMWRPPKEEAPVPDGFDLFNEARKKRLAEMELDAVENQPLTQYAITANAVRQIRSQTAAGMSMWKIAKELDITWDTVNRVVNGGKAEGSDE